MPAHGLMYDILCACSSHCTINCAAARVAPLPCCRTHQHCTSLTWQSHTKLVEDTGECIRNCMCCLTDLLCNILVETVIQHRSDIPSCMRYDIHRSLRLPPWLKLSNAENIPHVIHPKAETHHLCAAGAAPHACHHHCMHFELSPAHCLYGSCLLQMLE